MASKKDPLMGMNPDQSGPVEKIQNGDPKASPNSDQRSGCAEAGGPGPSKQAPFDNGVAPSMSSTQGLEPVKNSSAAFLMSVKGLSGETLPAGASDRGGSSPLVGSFKEKIPAQGSMEGKYPNQAVAENIGGGDPKDPTKPKPDKPEPDDDDDDGDDKKAKGGVHVKKSKAA
jgi:hypothetical protein